MAILLGLAIGVVIVMAVYAVTGGLTPTLRQLEARLAILVGVLLVVVALAIYLAGAA